MASDARVGMALEAFLLDHAERDVARALMGFAEASISIAEHLRRGGLGEGASAEAVGVGPDGDAQKPLDLLADQLITDGLESAGVRACLSEERDEPLWFPGEGKLLAAIDPLDGSSNLDANITVGSILSLLPCDATAKTETFLQPARRQAAAAIALYGPHTEFIFTTGEGAHAATLDVGSGHYRMTQRDIRIPEGSNEFAINASNSRHWHPQIQAYVDDCLAGKEGPRGKDFNMRWVATMAADAYRILMRGGVYLYPGDRRPGYAEGRLHRLYETNPVAFLIEQAGGEAVDGARAILDNETRTIHQRSPFIFGSVEKVEQVKAYYTQDGFPAARAPLFNQRGLLRG